jgi:hypothetical protein
MSDRQAWITEVVRCATLAHDGAGMAMVSDDDSIGDRDPLGRLVTIVEIGVLHGWVTAEGEIVPETAGCTGVSASWCPVHGDCSCPRLDTGEREEEAQDCPLHGEKSAHGDERAQVTP